MHCFVAIIAPCCVNDIYLHRELFTYSMRVYALNHPKRCNRHDECERDYIFTIYEQREGCEAGGRVNKKDGLTRYGDSHVKYKTS